jgi:hypothetical protein
MDLLPTSPVFSLFIALLSQLNKLLREHLVDRVRFILELVVVVNPESYSSGSWW